MKYYFICYHYRRYGTIETQFINDVIKGNPLLWLKETKENYTDGEYNLISFNEISLEEFVEFDGWFC